MKQAIIKALTHNVGLKLLALIFAFFLWLIVVNVDDPTQTRTFTAVVTVTNESSLTSAGKLYEIRDNVNTVSFRVTAKRSIIEKLSSSDFNAIADMTYLEDDVRIPVSITAVNYTSQVSISSKQNYLYVNIFDETTSKYVIEPKYTGEISTGLAVDSISCSPNVITVSGPEDVVTSIAGVTATIDLTAVTSDITESVIPVFYDGAGNVIDTSKLQLSTPSVDVTVDFVGLKSVDVVVRTSGTLGEGLVLGSITTDPTSVLVKGQPADLNDVTAIVIPESVINLSEITSSMTTTVDISSYLPNGVSLVDYANSTIKIFVSMEGEESKTVTVDHKNIRFVNIPDGATVALNDENINVSVFAASSLLKGFDGSSLSGYVDCAQVSTDGETNLILVFDDLDGVTVQSITVTVVVSGLNKDEESEDSEESKDSKEDKEDKSTKEN